MFFARLAGTGRRGSDYLVPNIATATDLAAIIEHTNIITKKSQRNPNNFKGFMLRLLSCDSRVVNLPIESYNDYIGHSIANISPSTISKIGHGFCTTNLFEASCLTMVRELSSDKNILYKIAFNMLDTAINLDKILLELDFKLKSQITQNYPNIVMINPDSTAKEIILNLFFLIFKSEIGKDFIELRNKCFQSQDINTFHSQSYVSIDEGFPVSFLGRDESTKVIISNKPIYFNSTNSLNDLGFLWEDINPPFRNQGSLSPKRRTLFNSSLKKRYDLMFEESESKNKIKFPNMFKKLNTSIFSVDYCNNILYCSWQNVLAETNVISMMNNLFLANNNFLHLNLEGSISLVFGYDEKISTLRKIPFDSPISISEYFQLC